MRLAVYAEIGAVGIENGHGVEEGTVGLLEEADGQHHAQFARDLREVIDGAIVLHRGGNSQMTRVLLDAEIWRLEQFLNEDDLRALRRRLPHQLFGIRNIDVHIPATGELRGRNGHFAFRSFEMCGSAHANTLPGLRMPLGSSACLRSRMVEISAAVRDKGR